MITYISRRALYSIPVILIAAFLLFWAVRITFDPCVKLRTTREGAANVARCRTNLKLDDPIYVQYGRWIGNAVQGDLGQSERTNDSVSTTLTDGMWPTLQLIFWGILVSAILSVSLGIYSAVKQYSVGDYVFTGLSFIGIAMPPFWFGLLLIEFFAVATQAVVPFGHCAVPVHRAPQQRLIGLQPRLSAAPVAPGRDVDGADHRGVEPLPARLDARRDVGRLHPHRARQGRAETQGDHTPRAAERVDSVW